MKRWKWILLGIVFLIIVLGCRGVYGQEEVCRQVLDQRWCVIPGEVVEGQIPRLSALGLSVRSGPSVDFPEVRYVPVYARFRAIGAMFGWALLEIHLDNGSTITGFVQFWSDDLWMEFSRLPNPYRRGPASG